VQKASLSLTQWLNHDTGAADNKVIIVLGPELFTNATELLSLEHDVFTKQEEHKKQIEGLRQSTPLDKVNE
jgi:hypothetical protein